MRLSLATLKADRQLWSRVIYSLFRPPQGELPGIAEAAFDALDHWCQTSTSEKDAVTSPAIDGAFSAIGQFVITNPDSAYVTCRRVGSYFTSRNINVSFTAVRRFVYPVFCRYTIYVSDLLIQLASSDDVIPSPVEMTLRGNAFQALFGLDHQYKHWPQLRNARDECVHGLLTWGGGNGRNRNAASEIMRYVNRAT